LGPFYRAAVDREERASELYAAMIGCYQRHYRPRSR
jgi:hypothetical protein